MTLCLPLILKRQARHTVGTHIYMRRVQRVDDDSLSCNNNTREEEKKETVARAIKSEKTKARATGCLYKCDL